MVTSTSFTYVKQLIAPLLVALLALFTFTLENYLNPALAEILNYQQQAISQGEFWRLFTGHFLHTNGFHLLLNIVAIALLTGLHARYYHLKNYALLFLLITLGTSTGIYYLSPELKDYVGLSGVLHGVFIWGAIMDIKHKEKTGYLLFLGICVKIAHEQFYGASDSIAGLIDANVAIDAHLWGAISGLLIGIYSFLYPKISTNN